MLSTGCEQQGFPAPSNQPTYGSQPDQSMPQFRPAPNRWLVTRRLDTTKLPPNVKMNQFQSWLVESDRITNIDDIVDDSTDIETEFAPFLSGVNFDPSDTEILEGQAEIFIGKKTPFDEWDPNEADKAPRTDLTIICE